MANFYYYDDSGKRSVMLSGEELQRLANSGVIKSDTRIENEKGKSAPAWKVQGLVLPDAVPKSVPVPQQSEWDSAVIDAVQFVEKIDKQTLSQPNVLNDTAPSARTSDEQPNKYRYLRDVPKILLAFTLLAGVIGFMLAIASASTMVWLSEGQKTTMVLSYVAGVSLVTVFQCALLLMLDNLCQLLISLESNSCKQTDILSKSAPPR